ncbi:MAG: hypothetical protein ACRDTT_18540, partial [Pseudonocardiaceae bacterium]
VWTVLEPYIRAERARRGTTYLEFFENAKVEADGVAPKDVYRKLKLKQADPTMPPNRSPTEADHAS